MTDCDCVPDQFSTERERRVLRVALTLNAVMFIIELVGGIRGQSAGLIADSLDMLSDASAYAIALAAVGRTLRFKVRAARLSGSLLVVLGLGAVIEALRRAYYGSEPASLVILSIATIALLVNAVVLRLISSFQQGEIHLKAAWIFTRADVIANMSVVGAAILVAATGSRIPDVVIGAGIGLYIVKEAVEILRTANERQASAGSVSKMSP